MNTWLIGMSGTGKTTLLAREIIRDLEDGNGLLVIDPTGDLTDTVLLHCPKRRQPIIIDPTDVALPVGFNPLSNVKNKPLTATLLKDTVKAIWDFKGAPTPVLDAVARNAIATLLEVKGSTLLDVTRLLRDKDYRAGVLEHVLDPFILDTWSYWERAYEKKDWKYLVSSTENKAISFGEDPRIRNILGQDSAFDLERVMFDQEAVFLRLPQSELGDKTKLFGSLFLAATLSAASRRGICPPFSIYIDDCQHFDTPVLEHLLSAGKRFNLNLSVVHQYLGQLSDELLSALLGNADMRVAFTLGIEDSERLHKTMPENNTRPRLHELEKHHVLTFWQGQIADMCTAPLPRGNIRRRRAVVEQSRRRYGKSMRQGGAPTSV